MRKIMIAPSILACDFSRLAEDVHRVEQAGADRLHVDIMDGHFVPNLSIGPAVIESLRPETKLPLDVHLMVTHPEKFIEPFARAGADLICFHIEVRRRPFALIRKIKALGLRAGIVINPPTGLSRIEPVLPQVDYVLAMTVNPGYGGQQFIRSMLPKIEKLRRVFAGDIVVDGGINYRTCGEAIRAGANILVAGTAVFGARDPGRAMERMKRCRR